MKRILLVVDSLDLAGPQRQGAALAAGLPRDEFDIHVCALQTCSNAADDPLYSVAAESAVIGQRWTYDAQAFSQLRKQMRSFRPDVVHSWPGAAQTYGLAAAIASGVRHIVRSHWSLSSYNTGSEKLRDWLLTRRSQALVANCPKIADVLIAAGVPSKKLRVIPSGVEQISIGQASRESMLAELGLPADARLIGAVGRLETSARIDDLIWAADLLKVVRDDSHLLVIGAGPRQEALVRFRGHCRIEDRVHFLGHCDNLSQLMPCFDLLWLGGSREGLPYGVMQAMACGLPVVAADCWGARELVVQGETGFIVASGDRAGLARNANKLLDQPALAQRLGSAGRARVESQFSMPAMISAHAALYREIIG